MTIADKLALLEQTKEAQRVKLGLPESLPFSRYHEFFEFKFVPSYLFLNGEQGVWFDPSDLSTMFQDVDGTVPVTKNGDPVALIKDKSGNDNHVTQTTASARPIYRTDGNLHWLEFDGVDDFLVSEPVNFSTTSVASAFFARQVVTYSGATNFSLAANINTSGTFGEYQRSAYGGSVTAALHGTALTVAQVADSSTVLSNSVISMRLDLSLETNKQEIDLRVNGAYPILAYGGLGSAGSGNFGTYPIYIGGTNIGVSNMVFRGLVVVNNYSTTEQVSVIENYLANKSGVTL